MRGGRGERLPLAAVMPHVQEWLDKWYSGDPDAPAGYVAPEGVRAANPHWGAKSSASIGMLVLCADAGVTPGALTTWLHHWRKGTDRRIGYFDADRLFTAMDRADLWYSDPTLSALREDIVG